MAKNDEKGVGMITEGRVAEMIAEVVKLYVTKAEVEALITASEARTGEIIAIQTGEIDERVVELIRSAVSGAQELRPEEIDENAEFDPAWLKGLAFRGAKSKRETIDGRQRLVPVPFEREVKPEDVLAWKVDAEAGAVTLVTSDGRKHTVEI